MSISFALGSSQSPKCALVPGAWREVAMFYKLPPDNSRLNSKHLSTFVKVGLAVCTTRVCFGEVQPPVTQVTDLWDRSSAQGHITLSDWPCSLGPPWPTAGGQGHKHVIGGRDLKPISHCHSVPRALSGSPAWQGCGASGENVFPALGHAEEPKGSPVPLEQTSGLIPALAQSPTPHP